MVELKHKAPEAFLCEEERGGYVVSAQMKEIWAIQLDMVQELDRVCKKHNIQYTVCGGTLLGAVRHKGYIPWDDDIDLIMFREEYEKLLKIAPSEILYPYFFQCAYTDEGYVRGHAQIRRSDTCAMLNHEFNVKYNQGIFVDIFVFDGIPEEGDERNKFLKELNAYEDILWKMEPYNHKCLCRRMFSYARASLLKKRYGSQRELFYKYDQKAQIYADSSIVSTVQVLPQVTYERSWWENLEKCKFEYIEIEIPSEYDKILCSIYGKNYMIPQKSPSVHGGMMIVDTNKSYKTVLKELEQGLRPIG